MPIYKHTCVLAKRTFKAAKNLQKLKCILYNMATNST